MVLNRGSRMKIENVMSMVIALSLLIMVLPGTASGEGTTITYTDPTGDYSNDGMGSEIRPNVDIVSVSVDFSSDPIIIELEVDGVIVYENSDLNYYYTISLDHNNDGEEETEIEISLIMWAFTSDYGVGTATLSSEVSGNGTDTLRIELPASYIAGHPGITDVMAEAEVDDIWNSCEDVVNEDFAGGTTSDDDDDTTPLTLFLPAGEDPKIGMPTDTTLLIEIDDYDFSYSQNGETYTMEQSAEGTGEAYIYTCAYVFVYYGKDGHVQVGSWETGPIDEDHTYGSHSYTEEFRGTGAEGSWTSWEWDFMSSGPFEEDTHYEDDQDYWDQLASIHLFVRAFNEEGGWNQDSINILEQLEDSYMDDLSDDDDGGEEPTSDDDRDDRTGFGTILILPAVLITLLGMYIKKRKL